MDLTALRTANPDHWPKAAAIRALTLDAVAAANSGHSGMPIGMADVATVLFEKHLKFDASAPHWPDRDRFILSAGHGSMLLYSLLHLTGYEDMTLEQIKNFRQWGAITAGHPEYGHATGIETTTGPLGQGIANSVGFAMAEEIQRATYGKKAVDHYTRHGWRRLLDGRCKPRGNYACRSPRIVQAYRHVGQQQHHHRWYCRIIRPH